MAGVMAAISILFDERKPPIPRPDGPGIALQEGNLEQGPYNVDGSVFFEFDLQAQDVEVCFDLTSAALAVSNGVTVEVNGQSVAVSAGENCFSFPNDEQRLKNYIFIASNNPNNQITLNRIELANSVQSVLGLRSLTRSSWDESSVRKVLKVFAFGGHASDNQIREWAALRPADAIREMLNFDQHNLKLSPLADGEIYTDTATAYGTLKEFSDFLANTSSNLPIPISSRSQYSSLSYNFDKAFSFMATVRGLNPFRQRIGYWETNYHLAVNADLRPSYYQVAAHYDDIMNAHESGVSYERVLGVAAKSAAIAAQYGHDLNFWRAGSNRCDCNDDFSREILQLFYGIFGINDPNHEEGSIRETSKMLTGMRLNFVQGIGLDNKISFTSDFHHVDNLTILGSTISGATASEKIDSLMPVAIQHPESLQNLPVKIISELADNNLDEAKSDQLRDAWALMGTNKQFLRFVRAYAISTMFHGPTQRKDFTSFERATYIANKFGLDNFEAYRAGEYVQGGRGGKDIDDLLVNEAAGKVFSPTNNVFGGQTATEAADSALIFQNNYNFHTDEEAKIRATSDCTACDNGVSWEKKWASVLPSRGGTYMVEDIAPWLWQHVTGSLDNYSELERAYLYAFLGSARRNLGNSSDQDRSFDFPLLMCIVEDYQRKVPNADISISNILSDGVWNAYCINSDEGGEYTDLEKAALLQSYSGSDIRNNPLIQNLLSQLGQQTLPLTVGGDANNDRRRHLALQRVNSAINFIFGTPFVFTEAQQ